MDAVPCADCGTRGGSKSRKAGRPARLNGARFGIDGKLCHMCFKNRAYRSVGPAKVKKKLTDEQFRAVEVHQALARRIANKQAARCPGYFQELRSAAYLGLIDAAIGYNKPFDWDSPAQFIAYAKRRIKGSCLDWLRSELGRYNKRPGTLPMDSAPSDDDMPGWEIESLDTVNRLISRLPKNARATFRLQYCHGLTIAEVSARLGLSASRIHFLNKQGLDHLRSVLKPEAYDRRASA